MVASPPPPTCAIVFPFSTSIDQLKSLNGKRERNAVIFAFNGN